MPIVTAYTEAELAHSLIDDLGNLAGALGWVAESSRVQRAVNRALADYFVGGVGDIADVTNVPKLEAFAQRAIWRAVKAAKAGDFQFGADQMTFSRQQVFDHADKMIAECDRTLAELGAGPNTLVVTSVVRDSDSDPYAAHPSQWGEVA